MRREERPNDIDAEREEQEALREREEHDQLVWDGDFERLMSQDWGRRIVWRALTRARLHATSFCSNAMSMAFEEGQKQEGYFLMAQIDRLCPETYHQMVRENTRDDVAEDRSQSKP